MNGWEIHEFLDEFQRPTGEYYLNMSDRVHGKFSNGAATNSNLLADITYAAVDRDTMIKFDLFEDEKHNIDNAFSEADPYTVLVLDADGKRHSAKGLVLPKSSGLLLMHSEGNPCQTYDPAAIVGALNRGGAVRFTITRDGDRQTEYTFTIEDASGFRTACEAMRQSHIEHQTARVH